MVERYPQAERKLIYRVLHGQLTARVHSYVDGKSYDEFSVIRDSEGRTIVDGFKELAGVQVHTVNRFDGGSDRTVNGRIGRRGEHGR